MTREVVCASEEEARAYASLDGMAVEQVTPLAPEAPGRTPPAPPRWKPQAAPRGQERPRVYGAAASHTWEYFGIAAAIVAGGLYFGATWHWVLMAPFIAVLVVAGLVNRRASLTITEDAVVHRPGFGRTVAISFYRIRSVATQTENDVPTAVVLSLEGGDQHWIRDIANLSAVAVEIASRVR